MKKIRIVLCMMACLFGLTACSAEKPVDEETVMALEQSTSVVVNYALNALSAEEAEQLNAMGNEYMEEIFDTSFGMPVNGYGIMNGFKSWNDGLEELGGFQGITDFKVKYNTKGDQINVIAYVLGQNGRTAQAEFVYDDDLHHTLESIALNVDYSMGEKMSKAGLNTLIGMGTVFCVLVFLAFIISLFRFIPKIQAAFTKKDNKSSAAALDNSVAQIIEKEEQEDDGELVAVISAAIAAYESLNGGNADGYVVRSIRRISSNRR